MREHALASLSTFAADERATFMGAALLVGDCLTEAFDRPATEAKLQALCDRYDDRLTPWGYLKAEGFGGRSPVDVVQGSRVDVLLETRAGLPITLAALVAHVAEESGQNADGVNFPGHFLVRVGKALVDPFQMITRTEAECLASLPDEGRAGNPFALARPTDILLRMFNNLKYHFVAASEYHRALEMVDCQLRVLPNHGGLFFEQGEYWLRLGSVQGARAGFEQAVAAGDEALAAMAGKRLAELADRRDTLH